MLMIRPALGPHDVPGGRAGGDEGALQIRVDHVVEIRIVHAQEQAVLGDAGVVDQHIEPAVLLGELLDGFGERLGVGDVADQRLRRCRLRSRISRQTCFSLSALRATATTCRPSLASRRTIASPMPRDPPVTMATRFSSCILRARALASAWHGRALCHSSRLRRRKRFHRQPAIDLLQQPRQHATRRQLDPACVALRDQRLHRLFPAHGLDDLIDQQSS